MAQRRLNHQKLANVFHRYQPHELPIAHDGQRVAIAFLHEDLDIVDVPQGLALIDHDIVCRFLPFF